MIPFPSASTSSTSSSQQLLNTNIPQLQVKATANQAQVKKLQEQVSSLQRVSATSVGVSQSNSTSASRSMGVPNERNRESISNTGQKIASTSTTTTNTNKKQSISPSRQRLIRNLQAISNPVEDCIFCSKFQGSKSFGPLLNKALYSKYSSSQNYFYSKDINDILQNAQTVSVIEFRDLETYFDENEYLKRYYPRSQQHKKLTDLTEYYKYHKDIPRIFIQNETHIMNRFHDKRRRIEYRRIKIQLNLETSGEGTTTETNIDQDEEEEIEKQSQKDIQAAGATPAVAATTGATEEKKKVVKKKEVPIECKDMLVNLNLSLNFHETVQERKSKGQLNVVLHKSGEFSNMNAFYLKKKKQADDEIRKGFDMSSLLRKPNHANFFANDQRTRHTAGTGGRTRLASEEEYNLFATDASANSVMMKIKSGSAYLIDGIDYYPSENSLSGINSIICDEEFSRNSYLESNFEGGISSAIPTISVPRDGFIKNITNNFNFTKQKPQTAASSSMDEFEVNLIQKIKGNNNNNNNSEKPPIVTGSTLRTQNISDKILKPHESKVKASLSTEKEKNAGVLVSLNMPNNNQVKNSLYSTLKADSNSQNQFNSFKQQSQKAANIMNPLTADPLGIQQRALSKIQQFQQQHGLQQPSSNQNLDSLSNLNKLEKKQSIPSINQLSTFENKPSNNNNNNATTLYNKSIEGVLNRRVVGAELPHRDIPSKVVDINDRRTNGQDKSFNKRSNPNIGSQEEKQYNTHLLSNSNSNNTTGSLSNNPMNQLFETSQQRKNEFQTLDQARQTNTLLRVQEIIQLPAQNNNQKQPSLSSTARHKGNNNNSQPQKSIPIHSNNQIVVRPLKQRNSISPERSPSSPWPHVAGTQQKDHISLERDLTNILASQSRNTSNSSSLTQQHTQSVPLKKSTTTTGAVPPSGISAVGSQPYSSTQRISWQFRQTASGTNNGIQTGQGVSENQQQIVQQPSSSSSSLSFLTSRRPGGIQSLSGGNTNTILSDHQKNATQATLIKNRSSSNPKTISKIPGGQPVVQSALMNNLVRQQSLHIDAQQQSQQQSSIQGDSSQILSPFQSKKVFRSSQQQQNPPIELELSNPARISNQTSQTALPSSDSLQKQPSLGMSSSSQLSRHYSHSQLSTNQLQQKQQLQHHINPNYNTTTNSNTNRDNSHTSNNLVSQQGINSMLILDQGINSIRSRSQENVVYSTQPFGLGLASSSLQQQQQSQQQQQQQQQQYNSKNYENNLAQKQILLSEQQQQLKQASQLKINNHPLAYQKAAPSPQSTTTTTTATQHLTLVSHRVTPTSSIHEPSQTKSQQSSPLSKFKSQQSQGGTAQSRLLAIRGDTFSSRVSNIASIFDTVSQPLTSALSIHQYSTQNGSVAGNSLSSSSSQSQLKIVKQNSSQNSNLNNHNSSLNNMTSNSNTTHIKQPFHSPHGILSSVNSSGYTSNQNASVNSNNNTLNLQHQLQMQSSITNSVSGVGTPVTNSNRQMHSSANNSPNRKTTASQFNPKQQLLQQQSIRQHHQISNYQSNILHSQTQLQNGTNAPQSSTSSLASSRAGSTQRTSSKATSSLIRFRGLNN